MCMWMCVSSYGKEVIVKLFGKLNSCCEVVCFFVCVG